MKYQAYHIEQPDERRQRQNKLINYVYLNAGIIMRAREHDPAKQKMLKNELNRRMRFIRSSPPHLALNEADINALFDFYTTLCKKYFRRNTKMLANNQQPEQQQNNQPQGEQQNQQQQNQQQEQVQAQAAQQQNRQPVQNKRIKLRAWMSDNDKAVIRAYNARERELAQNNDDESRAAYAQLTRRYDILKFACTNIDRENGNNQNNFFGIMFKDQIIAINNILNGRHENILVNENIAVIANAMENDRQAVPQQNAENQQQNVGNQQLFNQQINFRPYADLLTENEKLVLEAHNAREKKLALDRRNNVPGAEDAYIALVQQSNLFAVQLRNLRIYNTERQHIVVNDQINRIACVLFDQAQAQLHAQNDLNQQQQVQQEANQIINDEHIDVQQQQAILNDAQAQVQAQAAPQQQQEQVQAQAAQQQNQEPQASQHSQVSHHSQQQEQVQAQAAQQQNQEPQADDNVIRDNDRPIYVAMRNRLNDCRHRIEQFGNVNERIINEGIKNDITAIKTEFAGKAQDMLARIAQMNESKEMQALSDNEVRFTKAKAALEALKAHVLDDEAQPEAIIRVNLSNKQLKVAAELGFAKDCHFDDVANAKQFAPLIDNYIEQKAAFDKAQKDMKEQVKLLDNFDKAYGKVEALDSKIGETALEMQNTYVQRGLNYDYLARNRQDAEAHPDLDALRLDRARILSEINRLDLEVQSEENVIKAHHENLGGAFNKAYTALGAQNIARIDQLVQLPEAQEAPAHSYKIPLSALKSKYEFVGRFANNYANVANDSTHAAKRTANRLIKEFNNEFKNQPINIFVNPDDVVASIKANIQNPQEPAAVAYNVRGRFNDRHYKPNNLQVVNRNNHTFYLHEKYGFVQSDLGRDNNHLVGDFVYPADMEGLTDRMYGVLGGLNQLIPNLADMNEFCNRVRPKDANGNNVELAAPVNAFVNALAVQAEHGLNFKNLDYVGNDLTTLLRAAKAPAFRAEVVAHGEDNRSFYEFIDLAAQYITGFARLYGDCHKLSKQSIIDPDALNNAQNAQLANAEGRMHVLNDQLDELTGREHNVHFNNDNALVDAIDDNERDLIHNQVELAQNLAMAIEEQHQQEVQQQNNEQQEVQQPEQNNEQEVQQPEQNNEQAQQNNEQQEQQQEQNQIDVQQLQQQLEEQRIRNIELEQRIAQMQQNQQEQQEQIQQIQQDQQQIQQDQQQLVANNNILAAFVNPQPDQQQNNEEQHEPEQHEEESQHEQINAQQLQQDVAPNQQRPHTPVQPAQNPQQNQQQNQQNNELNH